MKTPKMKGELIDKPHIAIKSEQLPSYVKCSVCGKPPIGTDWLKPLTTDANCRKFVHLSHITNGPTLSDEAGFILRNS